MDTRSGLRATTTALVVLMAATVAVAQEFRSSEDSEQKAVLLVSHVVRMGTAPGLGSSSQAAFLHQVYTALHSGRFLCYETPASGELTPKFAKLAGGKVPEPCDLTAAVRDVFVPDVARLVDATRKSRAAGYMTEAERERFLATSAKSLGVNAQQLRRVVEFTYIAVPYIDGIAGWTKDRAAFVSGGIALFALREAGHGLSAECVGKVATRGVSTSRPEKGPDTDSFVQFGRNFAIAIKAHPDFQITTQILDVSGGTMFLTMGRESGLRVDDSYFVYETLSTGRKKRGFVRISKLMSPVDGSPVRSEAKIVGGGGVRRGMTLEEIPLGSWEKEVGISVVPYSVEPGTIGNPESGRYFDHPPASTHMLLAEIGANANIGRDIGVSQLYFGSRLRLGFTDMNWRGIEGDMAFEPRLGFSFGLDIGLCKRFYWRSLGLEVGGRGGALGFFSSPEDSTGRLKYEVTAYNLGGAVEGGLSYWVRPALAIRFLATKKWYGRNTAWKVKRNGSELTVDRATMPRMDFDHIEFKIVLSSTRKFF